MCLYDITLEHLNTEEEAPDTHHRGRNMIDTILATRGVQV